MAYDRYDTRREREGSRYPDQRDNVGRRDERGFFERAGSEIASWFGDDDDDRERRYRDDDRMGYSRDRGDWRSDERQRYSADRSSPRSSGGWTSGEDDYRYDSRRSAGGRSEQYRPMAGDYGRSQYDRSSSSGRDDYRRSPSTGSSRQHDPHYSAWRDRHLSDLDRDYDEYHRERQQHFENDFGTWREERQQKRQVLGQARPHMDVVGSDGEQIGKVDKIRRDSIILTKSDSEDGRHHSIPCSMVDKVDDDRLMLNCSASDAKQKWQDESHERALFEREDQGQDGPHMLDRSFSGTYR